MRKNRRFVTQRIIDKDLFWGITESVLPSYNMGHSVNMVIDRIT